MSTFLQKLKGKGVVSQEDVAAAAGTKADAPAGVTQLPVDVYQSGSEIVIFAQIPGTDISKLDVSIEGNSDVLTIQGHYNRPEDFLSGGDAHSSGDIVIHTSSHSTGGDFSLEECSWGQFFRQIILPEEIESERAQAKVKDGVLVLKLPLKGSDDKRVKMSIEKM
jgi:HSP20 family protein